MPNLNAVPVPQYQPNQPYHYSYDNLPLKSLEKRDEIINNVVDIHSEILKDAAGTQGTLANRLNQSLDEDGNLLDYAVDQSLHNIAEHTDGTKNVTGDELTAFGNLGYIVTNPVPFVRMIEAERDKLANIADEATNLSIEITTISNVTLVADGVFKLTESTDIEWQSVEVSPGVYEFAPVLKIGTGFAHEHHYDLVPNLLSPSSPFVNYEVHNAVSSFMEDSLKVYINGFRLSSTGSIYYRNANGDWVANGFTPDHANGEFTLDNELYAGDEIRVDFDISQT